MFLADISEQPMVFKQNKVSKNSIAVFVYFFLGVTIRFFNLDTKNI